MLLAMPYVIVLNTEKFMYEDNSKHETMKHALL